MTAFGSVGGAPSEARFSAGAPPHAPTWTEGAGSVEIVAPECSEGRDGVSKVYSRACHPSAWQRIVDREYYARAIRRAFNRLLREEIRPILHESPPSLLLILKGDWLDGDTASMLKRTPVPVACWTYDSMGRCPMQRDLVQLAAHTFCLDRGDALAAPEHRSWLPLGFDDQIYANLNLKRDIDILFVGSLGSLYQNRIRFLESLAASHLAAKARCALIGGTGNRFRDSRIRIGARVEWIAKRLPASELARYLNRSKITLNIHQDDGLQPVNHGFVSIPGTGTCQVAEKKEQLRLLLRAGEEYVDFETGRLFETLDSLLDDPEHIEKIAAKGRAAVHTRHTMKHRVQAILWRLRKRGILNRIQGA